MFGCATATISCSVARLVLECEWATPPGEIDYDFEKLMFARAEHRAMIFNYGDFEQHCTRLQQIVVNCPLAAAGERYLFLWWNPADGKFRSRVFIKQAQDDIKAAAA
jgi:hypothetical protein